ncbi:MAG: inorganic phosphate transporter [Cyanobacteria bacterium P01_F01_bin.143]
MIWSIGIFLTTVFLAYANGANDNFKGVATLFGSETINYKLAIWWATLTTFAGSIASIALADALLKNFSGKGLVPAVIANTNQFHIAVALGAGLTVILATVTGFPISTTHSLTGALTGAGLMAIGTKLNFAALGKSFFIPLLVSPLVATILAAVIYSIFRYLRLFFAIDKAWCVCAGNKQELVPVTVANNTNILQAVMTPDITINTTEKCQQKYIGTFLGIDSQKLIDTCHFISAGIVSFARGLNDTPKIVALLLIVSAFSIKSGMLAVGLGMAIGGLLNAKKVAQTVSKKITTLNAGKGLSANLVTGFLVIFASRLGVPVSTTHVSVGSIFGVGVISRSAHINVFSQVLGSWFLTLPIAAILSGITYFVLQ